MATLNWLLRIAPGWLLEAKSVSSYTCYQLEKKGCQTNPLASKLFKNKTWLFVSALDEEADDAVEEEEFRKPLLPLGCCWPAAVPTDTGDTAVMLLAILICIQGLLVVDYYLAADFCCCSYVTGHWISSPPPHEISEKNIKLSGSGHVDFS